jgi:AraC-like DNA-binding protein
MSSNFEYKGQTDEYFHITDINTFNHNLITDKKEGLLSILWFVEDDNKFIVDAQEHTFDKDQIICFTSFHNIEIKKLGKARFLRFNRPFYCILDHDSEVGCKGILFYGSSNLPVLRPDEEEKDILETVWKMIGIEQKSSDNLQLEMLQMMLKRLLILCTRIYKKHENYSAVDNSQSDIIRDFNFLVEQNFKTKHTVTEYAALLNKSPKTLSNLFGKLSDKSPLQYIQDRIILEAKRVLGYTDLPVSEIGDDLGFKDIQSFSRFFKKHVGTSPTSFRTARL